MTETQILSIYESIKHIIDFQKQINKTQSEHFNIIESLRAKETDHSRVLGLLLRKKESENYTYLKSYLHLFGINETPKQPTINIEKHHIDISIIDPQANYAIIIENKIHDATDQPSQLQNYYTEITQRYPNIENIYIQYLTKFGDKSPSEDSLPKKLEELLDSNFQSISYSDDIITWLESYLLPNCKVKDRALVLSIELYLDYLKRLTNKYPDNPIANKMKEKLKNVLGIDDLYQKENIKKLTTHINELNDYQSLVSELNKDITHQLRKTFFHKLKAKLDQVGNWTCVEHVHRESIIENCNNRNFGFKNTDYIYSDKCFSIEVQDYKRFLAGIFVMKDSNLFKELNEKLNGLIGHLNKKQEGWIVRLFREFEIKTDEGSYHVVNNFYDTNHNALFLEHMDIVVEKFFNETMIVFEKWKLICKE